MVKITRSFEFLHPIEKKVPALGGATHVWECRALLLKGRAALLCVGPHPIEKGWYRLQLNQGRIHIEVTFGEIIDMATNLDCLPELRDSPDMMAAFTDMAIQHMRAKFLTA